MPTLEERIKVPFLQKMRKSISAIVVAGAMAVSTPLYSCGEECVDNDGDGYGASCELGEDCDDSRKEVYPSAKEICDALDNDCDGIKDEGDTCPILFGSDMGGNHEIYLMNPDGSNLRQLTENEHWNHSPVSSPDRKKIAYISQTYTGFEINTMNADGTEVERIHYNSHLILSLAWSPDGSKILFDLYEREEDDWNIYEMGSDGSNPTPLIETPSDESEPAFSPDGTQLAYISNREDGKYKIYIREADGSERYLINGQEPSWSPDGKEIAFTSKRDGNWEIYTINVDGTDLRRLTHNDYRDGTPDWSPDGERIVFDTLFLGVGQDWSDIFVMNADGTDQRNITDTYHSFDMYPHWSP